MAMMYRWSCFLLPDSTREAVESVPFDGAAGWLRLSFESCHINETARRRGVWFDASVHLVLGASNSKALQVHTVVC